MNVASQRSLMTFKLVCNNSSRTALVYWTPTLHGMVNSIRARFLYKLFEIGTKKIVKAMRKVGQGSTWDERKFWFIKLKDKREL